MYFIYYLTRLLTQRLVCFFNIKNPFRFFLKGFFYVSYKIKIHIFFALDRYIIPIENAINNQKLKIRTVFCVAFNSIVAPIGIVTIGCVWQQSKSAKIGISRSPITSSKMSYGANPVP